MPSLAVTKLQGQEEAQCRQRDACFLIAPIIVRKIYLLTAA